MESMATPQATLNLLHTDNLWAYLIKDLFLVPPSMTITIMAFLMDIIKNAEAVAAPALAQAARAEREPRSKASFNLMPTTDGREITLVSPA